MPRTQRRIVTKLPPLPEELARITTPARACGRAPARRATRAEATAALGAYIEGWYNRRRRHSTLDCRSPVEYERTLTAA
jgi:transposase InsO family protein